VKGKKVKLDGGGEGGVKLAKGLLCLSPKSEPWS